LALTTHTHTHEHKLNHSNLEYYETKL